MNKTLLGFSLAITLIICSLIFSNAFKYRTQSSEVLSVVGMAQIDFSSDLIVWEGSYTRKSKDLKTAYALLKEDENSIRQYLKEKNIPDSEVVINAVNLTKEYESNLGSNGEITSNTFSGYNLTQQFKVESKNIDRIDKLSREATGLIEKGIELSSFAPRYYYTKLTDLKMDLLAKAAADAKLRAKTIAESADSRLGNLKKSVMGVFQITGKNSTEEYSYGGSYNTSERNKTASITIRMEYLID